MTTAGDAVRKILMNKRVNNVNSNDCYILTAVCQTVLCENNADGYVIKRQSQRRYKTLV